MTAIKKLTDGDVQFYPQTHTKAVIDDNGDNADALIKSKADASTVYTKTEIANMIVPANTTIQVVTSLPASGVANTIYRVAGSSSYSDYGWNGSQFVKLAEYGIMADTSVTDDSVNVVKSSGIADFGKSLLRASCAKMDVTLSSGGVQKSDGANYTSSNGRRTGYLDIKEGCDLIVNGITGSTATALALYDENKDFIQAEQTHSFVIMTAKQLETLGAKFFRCTISTTQVTSGEWFIIHDNESLYRVEAEGSVDGAIAYTDKLLKNVGMAFNEVNSVSSYGILRSNGTLGSATSSKHTDFLPVVEGADILFKGSNSSTHTAIAFYYDANASSFLYSLPYTGENECMFLLPWEEYYIATDVTIDGETVQRYPSYIRCTVDTTQSEEGDYFLAFTRRNLVTNCVSTDEQTLTDAQKAQARENIGAANEDDVIVNVDIDTSSLSKSHICITSENVWEESANNTSIVIPITPGIKYKASVGRTSVAAVLKSATREVGAAPDFADGYTERFSIPASTPFVFTCPDDANYIYMMTKISAGNVNPSLCKVTNPSGAVNEIRAELDTLSSNSSENTTVISKRLAEILGNGLTPLNVPTDNNGYELPTDKETLNMQKNAEQMYSIKWTPLATVPYNSGSFSPNVEVTGLPYSSVKEYDKSIGFFVSIHTFMTAVNNPYSLIYTENVSETNSRSAWGITYRGTNCACYYGTVCSSFTSYVMNMPIQWETSTDAWNAKYAFNLIKIYNQSSQGLKIGDLYWMSGHNRIIVGLKRAADGSVTHVRVAESMPPKIKVNALETAESFDSTMRGEHGIIYRVTEMYKTKYTPSDFVAVGDEVITPYAYNDDICTFAGDKASFREGDLVVINYDLKTTSSYTGIEVYKDDVLLDTYSIASIDQSALPEGQRGHALSLGTALTYGSYKARMTDGTNYSDYTYWEVIQTTVTAEQRATGHHVEFSSANGKALSYRVCTVKGALYCTNVLSDEEIANGQMDVNFKTLQKQQYAGAPTNVNLYLKVTFEGEYGRVTNVPLLLTF